MRCKGKTKSGARCKRNAPEGSEFCGTHVEQALESETEQASAQTDPQETDAQKDDSRADDIFGDAGPEATEREDVPDALWDTLAEIAVVGTVVVVALAFGRVLRII